MPFEKNKETYWRNKFISYLHDPFDKVMKLKDHENRARLIIEEFGEQVPNNDADIWKTADGIASGFERGTFPGYSEDPHKNGFIDFAEKPIITHPIQGGNIKIDKDQLKYWTNDLLKTKIAEIIGERAGEGGYSSALNNHEKFVQGRFLYTHLGLRFKLAQDNVAGFGALWHKIPADSRIPDHSIWHHNALVSALVSCMKPVGLKLDQNEALNNIENVGVMIFTVTPVQSFISKARKLRDYWTGSILLSWLAFEGIRWIIEYLGPDHVLYPSLLDQPLVLEYLKNEWKIDERYLPHLHQCNDIATFPNKVLFLVPLNYAEEIGKAIQDHIQKEWEKLANIVIDFIKDKTNCNKDLVKKQFNEQISSYWDISWVATPLLSNEDDNDHKNENEYYRLINEKLIKKVNTQINIFKEIINYKIEVGKLYPLTNLLAQNALSNLKMSARHIRPEQNGIKCSLCGEMEALTDTPYSGMDAAHKYKQNMESFWQNVRNGLNIKDAQKESSELKEHEALCSICLVKRFLARALNERNSEHILKNTFKDYESFPSTTEKSLYNYYKRKNIIERGEQKKIAQQLYDAEDDSKSGLKDLKNKDKYYALLLMDGDNMGKLIMGETIAATWGSVLHPEIKKRMQDKDFEGKYRENWEKLYDLKRLITPAIHSAISEALGDFALYGVPRIIEKHGGRLIYAGGDDVCAIMPIDTVLTAAKEISEYYTRYYSIISKNGQDKLEEKIIQENGTINLTPGKLSHGMGKGEKISISAGIIIAHYKEPLTTVIRDSHNLLDTYAKEKAGRNACAIELRKRSGGSRYFYRKWDDPAWESFNKLFNTEQEILSNSLLYNLELYKDGIEAIIETYKDNEEELKKQCIAFITSIVKKSIERDLIRDIPEHIYTVTITKKITKDKTEYTFNTDVLKMLAFLRGEGNE